MKKNENIFPILGMTILDCGFSPRIKDGCKRLKVETVLELLHKVQNEEASAVFGQRSWQELQDKIKSHCGFRLDELLKSNSYQRIILCESILAN